MNDWGVGNYLLAALFIAIFFNGSIKSWWFNRLLRKTVSLDRICRLADIGQKDLGYDIVESHYFTRGGAKGRHFSVQFVYSCPMALMTRPGTNPNHYVGDVQLVDTLSDATAAEEKVAQAILDVKKQYLAERRIEENRGE